MKPRLEATPATYTVGPGDTVSGIAERFGLPTDALLTLNGLDWSTLIFPGQVLALGGSATAPPPAPADSSGDAGTHTIAAGDTLWDLAETYGVSMQSIADANGISTDTVLQIGRSLDIPTDAPSSTAASVASQALPTPGEAVPLSEEMRRNAVLIIATARELGVNDYGIVVALAAAAQESGLINVAYGDRDSLGLFQQRPSAGWGTDAQVSDPGWSIPAFFLGVEGPTGTTRGLLDVAGWEHMSVTEAAQSVQVSAFPDHYAKWEGSARAWLAQLG